MFGGIGGAIKNLGEKAEGILEEQKKKMEELAIEKRNAAAAMIEQQKGRIGEMLWQSKSEPENPDDLGAGPSADSGYKLADSPGEEEIQVESRVQESVAGDEEAREEEPKSGMDAAASSVLGKAKGFLNF